MAGEPTPRTPDKPAPAPAPEGAGLPPNPDPAAEDKRRAIEREVYERRTQIDKRAEDELTRGPPPLGEV